jgi:hypothetical protein
MPDGVEEMSAFDIPATANGDSEAFGGDAGVRLCFEDTAQRFEAAIGAAGGEVELLTDVGIGPRGENFEETITGREIGLIGEGAGSCAGDLKRGVRGELDEELHGGWGAVGGQETSGEFSDSPWPFGEALLDGGGEGVGEVGGPIDDGGIEGFQRAEGGFDDHGVLLGMGAKLLA